MEGKILVDDITTLVKETFIPGFPKACNGLLYLA